MRRVPVTTKKQNNAMKLKVCYLIDETSKIHGVFQILILNRKLQVGRMV
jgi:hypothetical protein